MATTTNYSWTTPDDTALVKDGAAAIRSLGSSIDTTTKALNPSTTLGDIEYRSATANTNTRLGIGTSGQVLSVSGGVPAWTTPSSGSMTLLSTTTLSGSTTTISSIPTTYKDLRFYIKDLTFSTNNQSPLIRYNGDSGANYDQYVATSQVGIANDFYGSQNVTSFKPTAQYDMQNTATDAIIMVNLYDYTNTTTIRTGDVRGSFTKGYTTAGDRLLITGSQFYKNVGTAITSISFTMTSGTFTTGTVELYGVN